MTTKGPWHATDCRHQKNGQIRIFPDDLVAGRQQIANVLAMNKCAEDNARLIAAAPELLAALKAFLRQADSWHRETGHDECGATKCDGICECRAEARAAIEKAEGRT